MIRFEASDPFRYFGKRIGIVRHYEARPLHGFLPGQIVAIASTSRVSNAPGRSAAHGFGDAPTVQRACEKALGETLERYGAGQTPVRGRRRRASYDELPPQLGGLGLGDFCQYGPAQLRDEAFDLRNLASTEPVDWIEARVWKDDRVVDAFYPLPYASLDLAVSRPYAIGTTSGLALAANPQVAFVRALHEFIERDAFLTQWWTRGSPPAFGFSDLRSALTGRAHEVVDLLGDRVFVLDLTSEWDVPVFTTLIFGRTADGEPALSIGAGSDMVASRALERSVIEAFRNAVLRTALLRRAVEPPPRPPFEQSVRSFSDISRLYSVGSAAEAARFLIANTTGGKKELRRRLRGVSDGDAKARVLGRGARIVACDLTPIDLAVGGFHLIKVWVPEGIPLNGAHRARPFGCLKLRDVPSRELNPLPQPFN